MPVLNRLVKMIAKPIPRMVSPKVHKMVDYMTVGIFFGSAAWFWRRNKRAAVASAVCGGTELALVMVTDYPGGVKKVLSYSAHREIDYGLAAMVATMPESLAFEEEQEKKLFRFQGALITLLGELSRPAPIPVRRVSSRAA